MSNAPPEELIAELLSALLGLGFAGTDGYCFDTCHHRRVVSQEGHSPPCMAARAAVAKATPSTASLHD